jgi:hypothetical protein
LILIIHAHLSKERDSLLILASKKDSSISAFLSSFSEVEINLDSIRKREESLSLHARGNAELNGTINEYDCKT